MGLVFWLVPTENINVSTYLNYFEFLTSGLFKDTSDISTPGGRGCTVVAEGGAGCGCMTESEKIQLKNGISNPKNINSFMVEL